VALGRSGSVHLQPWPAFDPDLAQEEQVTAIIQVDGKLRDRIEVAADVTEEALREAALASGKVRSALGGRQVGRVIVKPPKLVSVVTQR
jgi:leucyl-tRNA synthetase